MTKNAKHHTVFTAKQLRVSAVGVVSLKMKFEGGPSIGGRNLCCGGLRLDRTVDSLLHVTYLHMTSYYSGRIEPIADSCSCRCN